MRNVIKYFICWLFRKQFFFKLSRKKIKAQRNFQMKKFHFISSCVIILAKRHSMEPDIHNTKSFNLNCQFFDELSNSLLITYSKNSILFFCLFFNIHADKNLKFNYEQKIKVSTAKCCTTPWLIGQWVEQQKHNNTRRLFVNIINPIMKKHGGKWTHHSSQQTN